MRALHGHLGDAPGLKLGRHRIVRRRGAFWRYMRRLVATAFTLLLLSPPAAQAADWRDGGIITDPDGTAQPVRTAIDAGGDALLAYSGYVDRGSRPTVRFRPFGGDLGPEHTLSLESEGLDAVSGPDGDPLLVSTAPLGVPRRLLVRDVRGDQVGAPQVLAEVPDGDTGFCHSTAAVGPGGAAIVLYAVSTGSLGLSACTLHARVRPSAGEPFGDEVDLSGPAELGSMQAAFDGKGRAIAAWTETRGSDAALRARGWSAGEGFGPPQDVAVPGERVGTTTGAILRVAPGGRAVLAFGSARPGGGTHVAAATGDTRTGFGAGEVLSGPAVLAANYGRDLDAGIGSEGTIGVTWRAGRDNVAKVQGAVAGPGEPLTSARTTTLSRAQARGPRVAAGAGRATFAWFRLVPGHGRSIESRTGHPGGRLDRVRRLSTGVVAPFPPEMELSSHGAAWIGWGHGPIEKYGSNFSVLKARKLTVTTGRFSRELDVLRARRNYRDEQLTRSFEIEPARDGAMLATVVRQRRRPNSSGNRPNDFPEFFQLRTYGE